MTRQQSLYEPVPFETWLLSNTDLIVEADPDDKGIECPACEGTGRGVIYLCSTCNGDGFVRGLSLARYVYRCQRSQDMQRLAEYRKHTATLGGSHAR